MEKGRNLTHPKLISLKSPDSEGLVRREFLFNATAQVSCSRDGNATEGLCDAGVIRTGNGTGEIQISWPDCGSRVLFFEYNIPVAYNQSNADGSAELTVNRSEDGDFVVFVGEARCAFPEAFMTGS